MDKIDTKIEKEIAGQGVFVSKFIHSLDPKKRITIPSEWRAQISGPKSLYVLPDVHDRCLNVFPASEMVRRLDKIRRHSITDKKARQFARVLASQSDLVAWDSQGRIRIKDELLNFAGLVNQVIMIGAFQSFELWSPDYFKEIKTANVGDIEEAARYIGF